MRLVAVAVVLGAMVGLGAFLATSQHQAYVYLGPLCRADSVRDAGFDPWTGEPVGNAFMCRPVLVGDPPAHEVSMSVPIDLVGRRAVPIPIGFMVGTLIAGLAIIAVKQAARTLRRGHPGARDTR